MSRYKSILLGLTSLACLVSVLFIVDVREVTSALAEIPRTALLASGLFLIATNLLAFLRFGFVIQSLGFRPRWRTLFLAFSIGQVSNHFLLNILGQSLTRAMILERAGVPFGASVAATYFERLLAAGLLFLFSIGSLWFLLSDIAFDLYKGGAYLLAMIGSMAVVGLVVLFTVLRDEVKQHKAYWIRRSLPAIVLTILAHASMLAAYAAILTALDPGLLSLGMLAALTIVMFTSSLPISFSGWGIRELSAATALSLVGVSSGLAVAAAFSVGLLTLVVMVLFAALSFAMLRTQPQMQTEIQSDSTSIVGWDALLIKMCALFCAVFVFFQIHVPLTTNNLTVNVADVAAITGGGLVALLIATKRLRFPLPRYAALALAGLSAVIVFGIFIADLHDMLGRWALINRGVGWLVLLSYVAVGSAFVAMSGEHGRVMITRALTTAGLAVCVIQLSLLIIKVAGVPLSRDVFFVPLQGYVNNQNAFAFQLASVAILMILGLQTGVFRHPTLFVLASLLLSLTMYFTKSRTGLVFTSAISLWMFVVTLTGTVRGWSVRHTLRLAAFTSIGAILVVSLLPFAFAYLLNGFDNLQTLPHILMREGTVGPQLFYPDSDSERWFTIQEGWRLFLNAPIFGSGLGAYVEHRLATGLHGDVIHSVPVWLLAETGVIGTAVVFALTWVVIRQAWRLRSMPTTAPLGWALLALISVFALGGLVHDFFYQRIFWFIFGVLAVPLIEHAEREGANKS